MISGIGMREEGLDGDGVMDRDGGEVTVEGDGVLGEAGAEAGGGVTADGDLLGDEAGNEQTVKNDQNPALIP